MKCYYSDDGEASWTEIEHISEYPQISTILDSFGTCIITLSDMEGALYSTYEALDFVPIKVEDESSNVIFKGYLKKKVFTSEGVKLFCSGFGERLQWTPITKNYILDHGSVINNPSGETITGFIGYIQPNGDVTTDWANPAVGDHYSMIDEDYTDPQIADNIMTSNGDASQDEIFDMETITIEGTGSITQLDIYVYGYDDVGTNDLTIGYSVNGVDWFTDTIALDAAASWKSVTFAGLSLSEANLAALQVKLTAANNIDVTHNQAIGCLYIKVTYSITDYPHALDLGDDDGNAITTWTADDWINDRDVGILITDNSSNLTPETWTCTGIGQAGGSEDAGNAGSLDTPFDNNTYDCSEDAATWDMVITPVIGGANIATTQHVGKIEINYRIGIKCSEGSAAHPKDWYFQIKKDASWITIRRIKWGALSALSIYRWFEGTYEVPEDDYTEFAKYLTVDVGNYDELKGIQIIAENDGDEGAVEYFVSVDLLTATIYYEAYDISPIMEQITDNGDSWIVTSGLDWSGAGVVGETNPGDNDGDRWKIGENTGQIIADISTIANVPIYCQTTLSKYIARWFKGVSCYDALKAVALLEGLHWWEDYANSQIVISAEDDFVDSTVDLTSADYDHDWEYEDDCNHYKRVDVYGQAAQNLHAFKEDVTSDSLMGKTIYEETITTYGDAKEVADAQFAELSVKRPSIKLTLNGTQSNLSVGKTVTITMERPTVGENDYPIRRIDRIRRGIEGIKTIIYAGLGKTPIIENIGNTMKQTISTAIRAHADRLISTPYQAGASLSASDIGNFDGAARAACIAQTITNGVTTSAPSQDKVYDTLYAAKTKRIPDIRLIPDSGFTSGNNNVYWFAADYATIIFGKTSNGLDFGRVSFKVPLDYKSGTDIYVKMEAWPGGVIAQIDDTESVQVRKNGEASNAYDGAGVSVLSPTALVAGTLTELTFTLANATYSFEEDDIVYMKISMDDNASTRNIAISSVWIEYTSDTVD